MVHECDGKLPPELPVKHKTVVPVSPHNAQSLTSANTAVQSESSKANHHQLQQSEVADARSKFEQVLQASRQAAAAAGSVHIHNDKKLLTTASPRCRNPENDPLSSLPYSQLVCVLFAVIAVI